MDKQSPFTGNAAPTGQAFMEPMKEPEQQHTPEHKFELKEASPTIMERIIIDQADQIERDQATIGELRKALGDARDWIVRSGVSHPSVICNRIDKALERTDKDAGMEEPK